MKKTIFITLAILAATTICSCGNSAQKSSATDETDTSTMSVDQILADASNLVGDTIIVDGVCSHLCKHGGRKAFILGSSDTLLLRCEAFPLMGQPFPQTTIHKPLEVTGILREERIDEKAVADMEHQYAMLQSQSDANEQFGDETKKEEPKGECDTERAARGQKNLASMADRIADYRRRIAERDEKEGKPYLSFYYLDAISYKILSE